MSFTIETYIQQKKTKTNIENISQIKYFKTFLTILKCSTTFSVGLGKLTWWRLHVSKPTVVWQVLVTTTVTIVSFHNLTEQERTWDLGSFLFWLSYLLYLIAYIIIQTTLIYKVLPLSYALRETTVLSLVLPTSFWKKLYAWMCLQTVLFIVSPVVITYDDSFIEHEIVTAIQLYSIWGFIMLYSTTLAILCSTFTHLNESLFQDSTDFPTLSSVKEALKIHDRAWRATEIFSNTLSLPTLVLIVVSLEEFLVAAYYVGLVRGIQIKFMRWSIFFIMVLLQLLIPATLLSKEARKTAWVLSDKLSGDECSHIRNTIDTFLLKNRHHNHSLQAGGVITLDMSLLTSLIGTTITYGVIIVQLQGRSQTTTAE